VCGFANGGVVLVEGGSWYCDSRVEGGEHSCNQSQGMQVETVEIQ